MYSPWFRRGGASLPCPDYLFTVHGLFKNVELMTQLESAFSPIVSKRSNQTLYGTQIVLQKTCVTTVVSRSVSRINELTTNYGSVLIRRKICEDRHAVICGDAFLESAI
jgi:hypothetical protein